MMRWAMPGVLGIALFISSWSALALIVSSWCGGAGPLEPVSGAEAQRIKAELAGRSFRQFDPDRDADRRKGVILDFFDGVTLWAQYGEGGYAVSEWEISSNDYRIASRADDSGEVTITFVDPLTRQQFPKACEDCIETSGVSISIRDVFDGDAIRFRVNDPEGVLQSPFPVFGSWTRFEEDEYFD